MRQAPVLPLIIRHLGCCQYLDIFSAMKSFVSERQKSTPDEIWLLEHFPVFTQGQAGNKRHLIAPGDIPVVQSDRGGHVTYHAPGQITGYMLIDMRRLGLGVRDIVTLIEKSIIETLAYWDIKATTDLKAPGVFVGDATEDAGEVKKIASLGLRIRRGYSYHGFNLNIDMDMDPWSRINPCGLGIPMAQMVDFLEERVSLIDIFEYISNILAQNLGYNEHKVEFTLDH
tara:strand:+ start:6896 stop:7579 length:684 start_codon:yes stop_codon:yes gene_type:complete